jgi:tRNA pseudouridine38-40 synthase
MLNKNKTKRNLKLTIMYDGSRFLGWQRLTNEQGEKTIQAILERVLGEILQESIRIIGSGRTDAGVHAYGQVANFHTESDMELKELSGRINENLPEGIAVSKIEVVNKNFHSRYQAKLKTYEYHMDTREVADVFSRKYALHHPEPLNVNDMKEASKYLLGEHDFKAFASNMKDERTTVRYIESIDIVKEQDKLKIVFKGNGFLYHMIRIMVGTLLLVGEGKLQKEDIVTILLSKNRMNAGPTISSVGLFLKSVDY